MIQKKLKKVFVVLAEMRKFARHYKFAPYQRDFDYVEQ